MKTYIGKRTADGVQVRVLAAQGHCGQSRDLAPRLAPRLDLWSHNTAGFDWGCSGPGAAQLALAILADLLKPDDTLAIRLHLGLKHAVIAKLDRQTGFVLTAEQILDWTRKQLGEDAESLAPRLAAPPAEAEPSPVGRGAAFTLREDD